MKNGAGFQADPATDLFGVFGELDRGEESAERHGAEKPVTCRPPLSSPRGLRTAGGRPAARHQHDRVQSGKSGIKDRLPGREHRGMNRARDHEGAEKQPECGKLAEDQHPDHGIAGKIFQNTPAGSLLLAIGCRHLLFQIRTPASLSSRVSIPVCRRTNRASVDEFVCADATSDGMGRGTNRPRIPPSGEGRS